MTDAIRNEIKKIEEGATRLRELAGENQALTRNAEIILTYVYLLKFITPEAEG